MRIFLFILGVFAAVVCFEKPAAVDGPWCVEYDGGRRGRSHELRVSHISTMLGDFDRGWCVVWAQSYVPRRVEACSI
jgi:hypothetical protein